ncbi:MAG TPA: HAD-IC family P-type ATPase, partial [Cyclobacteriaceae bacterium]|nr:HAD-IC family P-type ATPase [Cyclobacteriaceae bacterium]
PIAFGLAALFSRSAFDIITATGPGYLDSFTGLVFFLLIGKWFQNRTYESLSFERDYKSYFPLAIQRFSADGFVPVLAYDLRKGDRIRVRNLEIVPADSILADQAATVDYSFVSGESRPVSAVKGSTIYAGGKIIGPPVELIVEKPMSQSHLTNLWNDDVFRKKNESAYKKVIDTFARRFTWIVMAIAIVTAVVWQAIAPESMWMVLTSVLMVACPCALALAAPFTYGSMLRVFGQHQFYLKNADVIERLASVNAVVFDKTGTVTHGRSPEIRFEGDLSAEELINVKLLTSYSTHPLSTLIGKSIAGNSTATVTGFVESPGKGLEGNINGLFYRIGSAKFTDFKGQLVGMSTPVFVSIAGRVRGYFLVKTSVRLNMKQMLDRLGKTCVAMLSGDNSGDRTQMRKVFPARVALLFNQQPVDKMEFIKNLQGHGTNVLMVGDGLNDAGALKQADVGLAVSDDAGLFTPGCDGIIQGSRLQDLDHFVTLAKKTTTILKLAFTISFLYNTIALAFAVTGHLTPLVAAVLMPMSSISVVGFSALSVKWAAYKMFGNKESNT